MFKLESYLIPWLSSYLNKYVELKLDDLKLSLWEGDAVFKKLNLRLNVIENLTSIPITFTSGVINELRVRIPWTRITSEPIIITVNTLEFVAKLKQPATSPKNSTPTKDDPTLNIDSKSDEESSTGASSSQNSYIQNIINKIVLNIQIVVNNVIVKFVEDDMVLSLNMKSAEYHSVNANWSKAYIDNLTECLDIRKVVSLSDVTLCLDKCDSSGKVLFYQEPILYRCSLDTRLMFRYASTAAKKPYLTRLNFFLKKFDVSISDQQLRMLTRLIELFLPLIYSEKSTEMRKIDTKIDGNLVKKSDSDAMISSLDGEKSVENASGEQQGWVSWAWSYVPSITNMIAYDENSAGDAVDANQDSRFEMAFYIEEFLLTFKITESQENVYSIGKRMFFSRFLMAHLKRLALEINSAGENVEMKFGITEMVVKSCGKCSCAFYDSVDGGERLLMRIGRIMESCDDISELYLRGSMFEKVLEGAGEGIEVQKSRDSNGNLIESYGETRFGGLYLDQVIFIKRKNEDDTKKNAGEYFEQNCFALDVYLYNFEMDLSMNLMHRVLKIYEWASFDTLIQKYQSLKDKATIKVPDCLNGDEMMSFGITISNFSVRLLNPANHVCSDNDNATSSDEDYFKIRSKSLKALIQTPLYEFVENSPSSIINCLVVAKAEDFEVTFSLEQPEKSIQEIVIVEPCVFEVSYIDQSFKTKGVKKTKRLSEIRFDMPAMNIIIEKSLLFVLNFYLDSFIQISEGDINIPKLNLAKNLFKEHLYYTNFKEKSSKLKAKLSKINLRLSLTNLLNTIQLIIDSIALQIIDKKDNCISILKETQDVQSASKIDFFKAQCQIPSQFLSKKPSNTDQIFVNLQMNGFKIDIVPQLIDWLTYTPFEDVQLPPKDISTNTETPSSNQKDAINYHDSITVTKVGGGFTSTSKFAEILYDAFKSLNVNIQINSIKLCIHTRIKTEQSLLCISLPEISIKNASTKFYVENNDQPNQPFLQFNMQQSPQGANKFPILINMKNLQLSTLDSSTEKNQNIFNLDINSTVAMTPKINASTSVMKSLSFAIHCDLTKGLELNINKQQFNIITDAVLKTLNLIFGIKFRLEIDLSTKEPVSFIKKSDEIHYENFTESSVASLNILDEDLVVDETENASSSHSSRSSPLKVVVHERAPHQKVALNYWLQLTAYSVAVNMYDERNKVVLSLDDVSGFADINNTYQKVSLKFEKINLDHYVSGSGDKWVPFGFFNGILVDSSDRLSQELFLFDGEKHSKAKQAQNQAPNKLQTGSIFNLTFTRASLKSFYKKLTKDSDDSGMRERFYTTSESKWISELNVTLRYLDLIFHRLVFKIFLDFTADIVEIISENFKSFIKSESNEPVKERKLIIPVIKAVQMPLLNLEFGNLRLIFPLIDEKNLQTKSIDSSPIIVLQCLKTMVTSLVEQPITRNIYRNHSIYAKAKSTGMIYKPGFLFEDRQYQFSFQGLGVFCSTARHLNKHIGASATNLIAIEQDLYSRDDYSLNPASLWNQMSKESLSDSDKSSLTFHIEPILDYFDFSATLGLPIFYYNQLQRVEYLMSGYVIEINALTQDIDFYLSDKCINLAWQIVSENVALLNESLARLSSEKSDKTPIETQYEFDLIPVDLLATAEKLNFHLFTLSETKIEPLLLVYILEPHTCMFIHNKAQKFEVSFFDFNLREGSEFSSEIKRKNDGKLVPMKSEYSSYIIECKPGDPHPKTGILPSFFSFKLTNFLSVFQYCGVVSERQTLLAPSLISCISCPKCYEIDLSSSSRGNEKRISSSVVFSRPVKIKIDENFIKKVLKFTENIDFMAENTQNCEEITEETPKIDFKFCFMDNFHIKTSQMMLVMPITSGCRDELQLSFSNIHIDSYGNEPDAIENEPKLTEKVSNLYAKLKISDVLCKLSHEIDSQINQMHIFGPFSFDSRLKFCLIDNSMLLSLNIDSINITINRKTLEIINILTEKFTKNSKTQLKTLKNTENPQSDYHQNFHEDDLRSGKLDFIFTETSNNNISKLIAKSLPSVNQILSDSISICWRYNELRSLTSVKIKPIPFINTRDSTKEVREKLRLFLEAYNECTNSFEVLKEFYIQEETLITVLDYGKSIKNSEDCIYSSIWRIRLSSEAQRVICASDLVASTRVDSLSAPKFASRMQIDAKFKAVEVKFNDFPCNTELISLNFGEFRLQLSQMLPNESLSLRILGQISLEFIETRFLTIMPLIDSFILKTFIEVHPENGIEIFAKVNNLQVNISQSSLAIVTRAYDEFIQHRKLALKHYYQIVNDTDLDLNIKQFDTEETNIIKQGEKLNYSWRTHKKPQQLQIYIPKYKAYSNAFNIGRAQELTELLIAFKHENETNFIKILVFTEDFNGFSKRVLLKARLVCCNFLNFGVKFVMNFKIPHEKTFQVSSEENIDAYSRSKCSYHYPESINNNHTDPVQLADISIFDPSSSILIVKLVDLSEKAMRRGFYCENSDLQLAFWINFYEEKFEEYERTSPKDYISQKTFVFSPIALLCSYIPSSLTYWCIPRGENGSDLQLENAVTSELSPYEAHPLCSSSLNTNTCLQFIKDASNLCIDLIKSEFQSKKNVNLSTTSLNPTPIRSYISTKVSDEHKKLFYSQFSTFTTMQSSNNEPIPTPTYKLISTENEQNNQLDNFTIEKSPLWSFSNTIRVNIKPLCLLVNRTKYHFEISEQNSANKWSVSAFNEAVFPAQNISNSLKFILTSEDSDNKMKFESESVRISGEPGSPISFLRATHVLHLNSWIDLHMHPVEIHTESQISSFIKCINLVIESRSNTNTNQPHLIVIQPKFHIHNRTGFDLQLQINSLLDKQTLNNSQEIKNLIKLPSKNKCEIGEIYDQVTTKTLVPISVCCLNVYQQNNFSSYYKTMQSKPVILCDNEKAYRRLSDYGAPFTNRQFFCLYNMLSGVNTKPETKGFVCVQRLNVAEDGTLHVLIDEEVKSMLEIVNLLDTPIYIWPRLLKNGKFGISNASFEAYLSECEPNLANTRLCKEANEARFHEKTNIELSLAHYVPPKQVIKLSVEFIGCDAFPDGLNEDLILQFGVKTSSFIAFSKSEKFCRPFDDDFKMEFSNAGDDSALENIFYSSLSSNSLRLIHKQQDKDALELDFGQFLSNFHSDYQRSEFKMSASVLFEAVSVVLIDDCVSAAHQTEIIRLNSRNSEIFFTKMPEFMQMSVDFEHLQLDNQLYDYDEMSLYDFPVVFRPQIDLNIAKKMSLISQNGELNFSSGLLATNYRFFEIDDKQSTRNSPSKHKFIHFDMKLANIRQVRCEYSLIECVQIQIQPFEVYFEDCFVLDLSKTLMNLLKSLSYNSINTPNEPPELIKVNYERDESKILDEISHILTPIMIASFKIGKIDAVLNLRTSYKIHLSGYKMPISVNEISRQFTPFSMLSSTQFAKIFTSHYLASFLLRAGWILGSLDLIGSPGAFLQQVTSGIYDFVTMPYRGVRDQGVLGLVNGITKGSLSLLVNVSAGTITSVTSFAAFVSRNMDLLSFDPQHQARQEHLRHQSASGLLEISTSFLISIIGAIGGLAEQPIQSVHNSDSLLKGVSRGIIGLVTKPVGAVAELVNQTGDGFLRATGMKHSPTKESRMYRPVNRRFDAFAISITKCALKLIVQSSVKRVALYDNSLLQAVYHSSTADEACDLKSCYLMMSDEILFVIDAGEDMQHRAYFIADIDVAYAAVALDAHVSKDSVIALTLFAQHIEPFLACTEQMKDRIVDYVQQFNKNAEIRDGFMVVDERRDCEFRFRYDDASGGGFGGRTLLCECGEVIAKGKGDKDEQRVGIMEEKFEFGNLKAKKQYFFYVDPRVSRNFIQLFRILKRKFFKKGFQC